MTGNDVDWRYRPAPKTCDDLDVRPMPEGALLTSHAMKIGEACDLLDEAAKHVQTLAALTAFGSTYDLCARWLHRMELFVEEEKRVAAAGDGWRQVLPPVLWRKDGDEWRLNEDNTYSAVKSRMAEPYRYSYARLMTTGVFSHTKP